MIVRDCDICKKDYMFDMLEKDKYGKICQNCYEKEKIHIHL